MYDVYGRGMGMASQGWADLMRGLREGTQGVMQGLQTREILKQKKREKEYEEAKDKAQGILQTFTRGLLNIDTPEALEKYKETVSKRDKALILQLTGHDIDELADVFGVNLEARRIRETAQTEAKRAHDIYMEELRQKGRIEYKETPEPTEPEKPAEIPVLSPEGARKARVEAEKNLQSLNEKIEIIDKDIAKYETWWAKRKVGIEEKTALEELQNRKQEMEEERRFILGELERLKELQYPTWMSSPRGKIKTYEEILEEWRR